MGSGEDIAESVDDKAGLVSEAVRGGHLYWRTECYVALRKRARSEQGHYNESDQSHQDKLFPENCHFRASSIFLALTVSVYLSPPFAFFVPGAKPSRPLG